MPNYTIESRTRDGQYLATLPYSNIQGEFFRNKPCAIRWNMPFRHPNVTKDTFFPGKTEIWVLRDNTKIFTGPVWDANPSSKSKNMTCGAEDVSSYLQRRRVMSDQIVTAGKAQIAWSLIQHTQAQTDGSLGIIQGSLTSTPSIAYQLRATEGQYVWDAINDIVEMAESFDWDISPDRVFNTYARTIAPSNARLEYGGSVTSYGIQTMGKWAANDIYIKGNNTARSQITVDTAKRTEYGLRQWTDSKTAIKLQSDLNSYAEYQLLRRRDTRYVPNITCRSDAANPFKGDIGVGQTSRVLIDDGWVQIDQDMLVTGFQLTVGKNGNETFGFYMNDMRELEP